MFRRIIASVLACLLLVGTVSVLAETDDLIMIEDDIDVAVEDVEVPTLDDAALSLDALEVDLLSNDGEDTGESADQPVELSISKSVTKKVTLGLNYQIVVPGKTIKTCKSNDKKVATVTKAGLIKTKKAGTAKITITPKKGSKLTLKLKVIDPKVPTAVAINAGKSATLTVGETLQLTATVTPDTAVQDVTWKSSDKKVATVGKDGLVKALKRGKATITATTNNKLSAKLTLTVNNAAHKRYVICHAMGGINGDDYSNSLEAFQYNYNKGHRYFEVDFQYTSDGKLVLWHNWTNKINSKHKKGYAPTYDEFMNCKIYDKYTPLDLEMLLKLMAEYPDIYVITDTKYAEVSKAKKEFKSIVSTAKSLGIPEVLDQFIVEVYSGEMFEAVDKIHHFNEYMMSLYRAFSKAPTSSQMKSLAKYCKNHGIASIGMYTKWWKSKYTDILEDYGIASSLYTVNSNSDAKRYFKQGVSTLFTDYLAPI